MTAYDRLVTALTEHGCRRNGGDWQCPAHDDRRASLSVKAGDGQVLVHCHAGCGTQDVLGAVGLQLRDLYDEPRAAAGGLESETYPYVDEAGVLLFEVVRRPGKRFLQRRPDPTAADGWAWKLGETRRVLYRLPAVLQAVRDGGRVWVVEGERDVHALERAGEVATCNPGGAKKWRREFNEVFTGAEVIVIADRDDPGREHAAQVRDGIAPVAGSVRVVEAVTGKDARDHLEAGHGLDEFVPVDEPPAADAGGLTVESWPVFRDTSDGGVPVLVEDVWTAGGVGFIAAAPKRGKTWLALAMAISVATGRPFLGRFRVPDPAPVLYVALEGSRQGIRARVGAMARGMGVDPDNGDLGRLAFAYRPRGMNLSESRWAQQLIDRADQLDAGLVVVDVLRRAATIRESGEGAQDFAALLRLLEPLAAAGRSVAFCHHFHKTTQQHDNQPKRLTAERMAGSGALYGALDDGLFIARSDDGARRMTVEVEARDLATPKPFVVELSGEGSGPNGGWTYRDTITITTDQDAARPEVEVMTEKLRALRAREPGITQTKAAALVGTTRHSASFEKAWPLSEPDPPEVLPGSEAVRVCPLTGHTRADDGSGPGEAR